LLPQSLNHRYLSLKSAADQDRLGTKGRCYSRDLSPLPHAHHFTHLSRIDVSEKVDSHRLETSPERALHQPTYRRPDHE
jgi:hypothetical protein